MGVFYSHKNDKISANPYNNRPKQRLKINFRAKPGSVPGPDTDTEATVQTIILVRGYGYYPLMFIESGFSYKNNCSQGLKQIDIPF